MATWARTAKHPPLKLAPHLLQLFAARVMGTQREVTLMRADLMKKGYDVEMLVEMIQEYQRLPESQQGFVLAFTDYTITLRRKPGTEPPPHPGRNHRSSRP